MIVNFISSETFYCFKKEGSNPEGELVYCVHKSVLLRGIAYPSSGKFKNQSLWTTEQLGKTDTQISLWEVQGVKNEGTSAGSFVALPSFSFKRTTDVQIYVLNIANSSSNWEN